MDKQCTNNSARWQRETRGLQTPSHTVCDLTSAASHCFSLCCLCHHQVALVKKAQAAASSSSSSLSLSFDMLLIWQVKVSFVASTSAFILLSAPSAQWCKSHMLLFHMTVLLLLLSWLRWRHLPSSDHSLDKDWIRRHLPPSRSTSRYVRSFKRATSCWVYESKNHVMFHYRYC